MHDNKNLASQNQMGLALKQNQDIDFFRARFNLPASEVEKAIRQAGDSREKIIEYLRKIFSRK
jgi:Protein of unknown function (DUF3606)